VKRTQLERLRVSDNRRYLVTESGRPFFWLADTAWELLHRCTREEIALYLENRQRKGFNVVQMVVLAELDGLHTPNPYGDRPLVDDDPRRPNEAYFEQVDFALADAADRGLYVALLPTWGDKVTPDWGAGPVVFTPENARAYGAWLAARYEGWSNLIWVLGGDRPLRKAGDDWRPIWRAMAAGIRSVVGEAALLTYHPDGGPETPTAIHAEGWADVVMLQSGHWAAENPTWRWIGELYRLSPPKPVLDAEPNYEDHPVAPWPTWDPADGYFRDYAVRRQAYRSVFAGGCGVTYGHHFVWQMYDEGREVVNNGDELLTWRTALDRPAAAQMQHLKRLMLSRPYLTRIPDQGLLVSPPGEGRRHIRATRDREGRYALVYVPEPARTFEVDLRLLESPVHASWYDPRTGGVQPAGRFPSAGLQPFRSPDGGPDWVLILDGDSDSGSLRERKIRNTQYAARNRS
jgi:hypothetical protein